MKQETCKVREVCQILGWIDDKGKINDNVIVTIYDNDKYKYYSLNSMVGSFNIEDTFKTFNNTHRICLALHTLDGAPSHYTFFRTKCVGYADLDSHLSLEEIESLFKENDFIKPTYLHKTYKGWHFLWVCEDWIDDKAILTAFSSLVKKNIKQADAVNSIVAKTRTFTDELFTVKFGKILSVNKVNSLVRNELKLISVDSKEYSLGEFSVEHVNFALQHCEVLKQLDSDWSNHSYEEWDIMSHVYAIKSVFDKTAETDFIQKSLTWKGETVEKLIKQQFFHQFSWVTKDAKILHLYGCPKFAKTVGAFVNGVCKFKKQCGLTLYNTPFKLKDVLEQDWFPFFFTQEGLFLQVRDKEGEFSNQLVCDIVSIDGVYDDIGGSDLIFFKVLVNRKGGLKPEWLSIKIGNGKDKGLTILPISLKKIIVEPNMEFHLNTFLTLFYNKARKEGKFRMIYPIGYRNYSGTVFNPITTDDFLDFTILNVYHSDKNSGISEFDLKSKLSSYPVPMKYGYYDSWLKAYRDLPNDWVVWLLIGYFMTLVTRGFIQEMDINPVICMSGDSKIGKTLRAKVASALFGSLKVFSYNNITYPKYTEIRSKLSIPFVIDEVDFNNKDLLSEDAIFNAAINPGIRTNKFGTVTGIGTPTVFIGEVDVVSFTELDRAGHFRRMVPINLSQDDEELVSYVQPILASLNVLKDNFGFMCNLWSTILEKKNEFIDIFNELRRSVRVERNLFEEPTITVIASYASAIFFDRLISRKRLQFDMVVEWINMISSYWKELLVNINEVSIKINNQVDSIYEDNEFEDVEEIEDDSDTDDVESVKSLVKTTLNSINITKNTHIKKRDNSYIYKHKERIFLKALKTFTTKSKVMIRNMTVLYNLSKQNVPNQYISKVKRFLGVMLFKKDKTYNHVVYSIYWTLNPANRKDIGDLPEVYIERCYFATYKRLFSWYKDELDFVDWLLELDFNYITLTDDLFYSIGQRALTSFYIETKKEIQKTNNNNALKLLEEFYNKAKNYYEQQNKNYMIEQEVEI